MKKHFLYLSFLLLAASACKKKKDPHVPPDVVFKTGAGYTYQDITVGQQDTLTVGIMATKTEDDLKSYNVSYAYDGASTTQTFYNYYLSSAEITSFSKDIQIITRAQAGIEKWFFTIIDRDGNVTQLWFTLTVQ